MADNNGTNKAMAPSLLMPLSVTSVSQRGVGRGAQLLLTKIVHQQLRHVAKLHHLCASFEFSLELASLSPITPSPSTSLSSSATIFVNIVVVSRRPPRHCHRCPHHRRRAIVAPSSRHRCAIVVPSSLSCHCLHRQLPSSSSSYPVAPLPIATSPSPSSSSPL